MSVLAVVSKAVFEKDARIAGKLVGIGGVWPTALYASQSPGLASLAEGGALFLATVRPGDQLWLVGVLESPKHGSEGWSAAANTTPVRDITALVPQLRFSTGKGIHAEPGKLGMSLQTPRQLTAEDEALLRGGAAAPARETKSESAPAWKLDGYRRRALTTNLTKREGELLDSMMGLLEANDEDEMGIELADVVDTASGEPVALLALWPMEAGILVDVTTGENLADIYELVFDAHGDAALRDRMKAALDASTIRFDDPPRDFSGKRDQQKRRALPEPVGDDPALLAEIAALHGELDASKSKDVRGLMGRVTALMPKVLGRGPRPFPMVRPSELTKAQRAWLELAFAHYPSMLQLAHWGLPWKHADVQESARGYAGSPLARMLGKKPPLALDTIVELDGEPHPLWAILSDAFAGLRPEATFLDRLAIQPLAVREAAWRQIATCEDRLDQLHPRTDKELQRGWAEPKDQDAAKERYHRMLRAVFDGLGDRGEDVALAALRERVPESAYERGSSTPLRIAALDGLARRAKAAGGVLDPKWDAAIVELTTGPRPWLIALLSLLPPERAGEVTGLDYHLLEAFPSESGLLRLVAEIAGNESWQSAKGSMTKLAAKLAAKFPDAALPALNAAKPKLNARYRDGLDKAIEAATKALAKKPKPKAKKK